MIQNSKQSVNISLVSVSPQLIEPQGPGPRYPVAEEGGGDQGGGGGGRVSTGQVQLTTVEGVHSVTENIMRVRRMIRQ